jgi:hypothetical protein
MLLASGGKENQQNEKMPFIIHPKELNVKVN